MIRTLIILSLLANYPLNAFSSGREESDRPQKKPRYENLPQSTAFVTLSDDINGRVLDFLDFNSLLAASLTHKHHLLVGNAAINRMFKVTLTDGSTLSLKDYLKEEELRPISKAENLVHLMETRPSIFLQIVLKSARALLAQGETNVTNIYCDSMKNQDFETYLNSKNTYSDIFAYLLVESYLWYLMDMQIVAHLKEFLSKKFPISDEDDILEFSNSREFETSSSSLKHSLGIHLIVDHLPRQLHISTQGTQGLLVWLEGRGGEIINEGTNSQFWPFNDDFKESIQRDLEYFNLPQAYQIRDLSRFQKAERYIYMIYQVATLGTRQTKEYRNLIATISDLAHKEIGEAPILNMLGNILKVFRESRIEDQEDILHQIDTRIVKILISRLEKISNK